MISTIITKILLGISLAAPMGPVSAEMIKRGLEVGFWGSFNVRLGGAIANIILLILAYFGLNSLLQYPKAIFLVSIIGVLVLFYLGLKNVVKSLQQQPLGILKKINTNRSYSIGNGLLIGFTLSFFCPISLMFWLSTFATSVPMDSSNKFNLNDLLMNLFIIMGIMIWGISISTALHFGKKIINENKLRWITAISGLILIYFGIKYAIISIQKFM